MPDPSRPVGRTSPAHPIGVPPASANSAPGQSLAVRVQPDAPTGVVAALQRLLDRIDQLRDRPAVGVGVTAVCVVALAALWWVGRPVDDSGVERSIPLAAGLDSGDVAAAGDNRHRSSEADGPGAAESAGPEDGGGESGDAESGGAESGDAESGNGESEDAENDDAKSIVVHVSGAVVAQGLVTVGGDARIADAVTAAGGPVDGADLHRLNLAARAVDGQHIRVPLVGEEPDVPLVENDPAVAGDSSGAVSPDQAVNVNTADAGRLEDLPGVGPATAAAIIMWRTEHGPFESVDDLLLVSGVGPAKLAAMRDQVAT